MTEPPDMLAYLEGIARMFERYANSARLDPKSADAWLAKALGARAVASELRRLQRVEVLARAIDAIFDERSDVVRLRCRVADGAVDHREHFLKLRKVLEEVPEQTTENAKGEPA